MKLKPSYSQDLNQALSLDQIVGFFEILALIDNHYNPSFYTNE